MTSIIYYLMWWATVAAAVGFAGGYALATRLKNTALSELNYDNLLLQRQLSSIRNIASKGLEP